VAPIRPLTLGGVSVVACVVLLAAVGCAARPAVASGSGGPRDDPPAPVAAVGDARISKADLADFQFVRYRERWAEAVDELVDERIVAAEAARLAIVVPPSALDAAVDAEVAARREQLRARFGDAADLAASVKDYYGFDVETWRRTVLAPRLVVHLALSRVVRLSARMREHVLARVIAVRDRAKATTLREKLDRGADFSLLALEESEDPSRKQGGVVAPIGRGDLPSADAEAALFSAAAGAVVGPLEVSGAGGVEWHLFRVIEKIPAWTGAPGALLPRLEEDLAKNPVTTPEYDRWSARTRRAYAVRVFAPDGSVLSGAGSAR
jgi:hypothetical protein